MTREQHGDVRYSITVFSNPRHLLMKVAGPIGRGVQRRFLQRYFRALITLLDAARRSADPSVVVPRATYPATRSS